MSIVKTHPLPHTNGLTRAMFHRINMSGYLRPLHRDTLEDILGLLQANEGLKVLLGIGTTLSGRLLLFDALETEFVCIPRPMERSTTPDGGPLLYRVSHRVRLWKRGDRPRLEQRVLEGTPVLSL